MLFIRKEEKAPIVSIGTVINIFILVCPIDQALAPYHQYDRLLTGHKACPSPFSLWMGALYHCLLF